MQRAILVTGASTGIGRAVVERAVTEGARVFGTVRSERDAAALEQLGVAPLRCDVTDARQVASAVAAVAAALEGQRLSALVNNAGIAVPGPLELLTTDDLRRQFEVNLFGLHEVTRACLPLLGTDAQRVGPLGRVVMISSTNGVEAGPLVGPYAASKHALEGYSKSLRQELMRFGIPVTVVAPGPIRTPIWDKVEQAGIERFMQSPYGPAVSRASAIVLKSGRAGLPAERVADVVWNAVTSRRPRRRLAVKRWMLGDVLFHLLPERWRDALVARYLGLRPSA